MPTSLERQPTDQDAFVDSLVETLDVGVDVEDYGKVIGTVNDKLRSLTSQELLSLVPLIEARIQAIDGVQETLQVRQFARPLRAKIAAVMAMFLRRPAVAEEFHNNEERLKVLRYLLTMVNRSITSVSYDEDERAQGDQFAKEKRVAGELTTGLRRLVLFGDENVAPTGDGWGIIVVDRSLGEDDMRTFIQTNEAAALRRAKEVSDVLGRVDDPSFDPNGVFCVFGSANFNAYAMDEMIRLKGNLDDMPKLDEVTARIAQIEKHLEKTDLGGLIDGLPYPQFNVVVGLHNDASFSDARYCLIVDINQSVEDNIAFVRSVLECQNPKQVEDFLVKQGSQAKLPVEINRQLMYYVCAMTCKEVDIPWFVVKMENTFQAPAADPRRAGGIALSVDESADPEEAAQFIRDNAEKWKELNAKDPASSTG